MTTRVYIGRLAYGVREKDIEKFFKGYGRINEILIKNGFGFVEFDDYRDADDAVYELNGKELLGERVAVEHARGVRRNGYYNYGRRFNSNQRFGGFRRNQNGWGRNQNRGSRSSGGKGEYEVLVDNLSSKTSWQDLKDYMRQVGEVTYADAHKLQKNKGLVKFSTYDAMMKALEKLDNTELDGRRIRLTESKRNRSLSRSRSRSSNSSSRSSGSSPRSSSNRKRSRSTSSRRRRSRSSSSTTSKKCGGSKREEKSSSREKSPSKEDKKVEEDDSRKLKDQVQEDQQDQQEEQTKDKTTGNEEKNDELTS